MPHLITVPNFVFPNGDETPLTVSYYNGSIEITQIILGTEESNSICLSPKRVKDLLKEIIKHQKEAEGILSKKP